MIHISAKQLMARLVMDNPWWEKSHYDLAQDVPEEQRLFFPLFRKSALATPRGEAGLLTGPGRAGKSVMIRQLIQTLVKEGTAGNDILYYPLKTPVYFGLSLKDCLAFAREGGRFDPEARQFVFFDDIQYVKGWEQELQNVARLYQNSLFIGISSLAPAAGPKARAPGFTEFLLPFLTFAEYMHLTRNDDLFDPSDRDIPGGPFPTTRNIMAVNRHFMNYIKAGGYPEAVFSWEMRREPERFAKSAILDNILLSDVPNLYGIGEIKELNRFFCALALANGMETSQDRLRKDSGLAKNTMRRYLGYLEASFLMYRLRRVDEDNKEFLRERFLRLFLANPCLYSALFAAQEGEEDGPDETVMKELVRSAAFCQFRHTQESAELRYARWNGGEVDCLLFTNSRKRGKASGKLSSPAWIASLGWTDEPLEQAGTMRSLAEYCTRHKFKKPVLCVTRARSGREQGPGGLELELLPAALFCHGISARIFGV